jgi:hypothetical protein
MNGPFVMNIRPILLIVGSNVTAPEFVVIILPNVIFNSILFVGYPPPYADAVLGAVLRTTPNKQQRH